MLRRTLAALAVAAGLLAPVAGPASAACAGDGPHAALVVSHDGRTLALCVALDAERVTGLHLIELAGEQHGLDHAFGYGGQAVCRLDGVGTASETCFEEDDPFYWAYFRLEGGRWTYSPVGAGSTFVEDGDVEGWAWGAGGASSHPRPPLRPFADVCGEEGQARTPGGESGRASGGGSSSPAGGGEPAAPREPGAIRVAPPARPSREAVAGRGEAASPPDPRGPVPAAPGARGGRARGSGPTDEGGVRPRTGIRAAAGGDGSWGTWPAGAWASLVMSSGLLLLAARRARRSA